MCAPMPSDAACVAFEFEREVMVDSTLKCRSNIFGVKHMNPDPEQAGWLVTGVTACAGPAV